MSEEWHALRVPWCECSGKQLKLNSWKYNRILLRMLLE